MIAYQDYVKLAGSRDSAQRGQAAHFAASALAAHDGPADEQAALYAAAMSFLDDPSVKVRAALAYGLLHSDKAPRPLMLALLSDLPIIARAVAQYSPVLLDADLLSALRDGDLLMARAVASRAGIGPKVVSALLRREEQPVSLALLERKELAPSEQDFEALVERAGEDAKLRGALLARADLPAPARLSLVGQVRDALMGARIVKGAVAPKRLERLMRNATDDATTRIGQTELARGERKLIQQMAEQGTISTRLMLQALIGGRVLFFAASVAALVDLPDAKVVSILERGGRSSLAALIGRTGMGSALVDLMVRLILHARMADLADDLSARYFVVTALIDELIIEHDGDIPAQMADAFAYLNEQNVMLARKAARGVMAGFAAEAGAGRTMPMTKSKSRALAGAA